MTSSPDRIPIDITVALTGQKTVMVLAEKLSEDQKINLFLALPMLQAMPYDCPFRVFMEGERIVIERP